MASGASQKRRRVTFACHRRELARQAALTFDRFGIRYGFIAANMRSDPFALVQIASHGTLANRPSLLKCDLFVPDEAHLWGAKSRAEMITEVRALGAHIVPLTATPERGDGKGLAHIADHMIHGPSAAWLIERGHLARYKAYAPVTPDFRGLHTVGGDFVTSELEERFSKPTVFGDRVAAYKKFAYGKRAVAYCYSRKDGRETAATFRANGIPAVFIDGETPDDVRIAAIADFAAGRIWVLISCQLLTEGFDVSAQVGYTVHIQAVLLYTPTKSLPRAIQMMMRTMRPQDGFAIILDHVNLLAMHGLPDDERDWSLEGIPRKQREAEAAIATMRCEACFGTFRRFVGKCPGCGAEQKISDGRKVLQEAAEIAEIDLELVRQARKDEVRRARDLSGLISVARERGYKAGWVANVMKARGKTVSMDEVYRAMRG
jgi:superfamily II DNA or RNA helicase